MRADGLAGAKRRGKSWRTTRPARHAPPRADLVNRDFTAADPDELWVADLPYLGCWEGVVFFSFVLDAFSRREIGWQLASHMRTTLVLDALRMAHGTRRSGADVALCTTPIAARSGVVWAAPGRNAATLQGFFDQLTDAQKLSIKAVSIDMSVGYEKAITEAAPDARAAFAPFHVVQLGGKAADQVRRAEYNRHGRSSTGEGKWIKGARYSLLKDTANQTPKQLLKLAEVVLTNKRMYRAFLLLGELRHLYRLPKDEPSSGSTVARVGVSLAAEAVRQARANDPPAQGRRARGDRD